MTDNSDFRSRYLPPPTTGERHDPSEDASMPDPAIPEPEALAPPPPHDPHPPSDYPPPGRSPLFAPPPVTQRTPTPPAQASAPPPPPGQTPPPPGPYRAPSYGAGHSYPGSDGNPWGSGGAWNPAPAHRHDGEPPATPAGPAPAPIPHPPRLEDRSPVPPAQQWSPAIDPTERWTPRADPQASGESFRTIEAKAVVKPRREPATMGWRKTVYTATGTLVNLGAGKHEKKLLDWTNRINANIPGNYQIAAISMKGGVGKTRLTAAVGSVFAYHRGGGVIAIDADDTAGRLGEFIDPKTRVGVREFLADADALTHPKTRPYTGRNRERLEVLASYQNVATDFPFDEQAFFDTIRRTRQIYQPAMVDCAAMKGDVFKAVLSSSDALMIIGSCTVEGAKMIERTLNWLAARRGHELLHRSVIVLNDTHRSATPKLLSHVNQTFSKRVKAVLTVPWDPHLRDAPTLDFPALRKDTQEALMELAAELSEGFATAGALRG